MSNRLRYRAWLVLTAIFLLALGLRLAALRHFRFVGVDGGIDGVAMARAGQNLFSGKGFSSRGAPELIHAPLFPVLVGLCWRLSGDLEFSGQLVSVIFGAITVFPVYFLARALFGSAAAVLSALMTAVCPVLLYTATEVRLESLYSFLVTLAGLALYRLALKPGWRTGFLAGAVLAFSYLTRPEAILFLPLALVLPVLAKSSLPGPKAGRVIRSWVALILAFTVLSFPYWRFLRSHLGYWTLSARAPFTLIPYIEKDWERTSYEAYEHPEQMRKRWRDMGGAIGFFRLHAHRVLNEFDQNLLSLSTRMKSPRLEKFGLPPALLPAAMISAAALLLAATIGKMVRRRWRFRDTFLLLFFSVSLAYVTFISNAFFTPQELRYFYYFLPVGLIVLSAGCLAWARWIAGSGTGAGFWRSPLAWFPAAVLVLMMLAGSILLIPRKIDTVPYEYKLLGLWMRENLPGMEGTMVLSRKMGVPFYAGARHALIYPGTYQEILDDARKQEARYLVVDDWTTPWARPSLMFLLEEEPESPLGLEKVCTVTYRGRKAILYRVLPEKVQ